MAILQPAAPGVDTGEPVTVAPAVSPDLVAFVRPGPAVGPSVPSAAEDAARAYEAIANAADTAAAVLPWLDGLKVRLSGPDAPPGFDPNRWLSYARQELYGLPWALSNAAAFVGGELPSVSAQDRADRRRRCVALRIDPAADPEATFADVLVDLDHARDELLAVLKRIAAAPDPLLDAMAEDIRGAEWSITISTGCLVNEIRQRDWDAAWDRLEARHAAPAASVERRAA